MNNAPTVQDADSDQSAIRNPQSAIDYFTVADIARACRKDKETIRAAALREQWPMRWNGNRQEFSPSPEIARIMIATPASERQGRGITVKFADLHDETQIEIVLRREKAVLLYRDNLHLGKEIALETTAAIMRATFPNFKCSARNLRRWNARYGQYGLDGLVEQKRGNVGRKAFADQLDEQTVLRYKAAAIEHGNARKGDGKPQLNKARAYRSMVADPTLRGPIREWLHGAHASKSYMPPSVRRALDSSILTASLIQRGPKAAKLDGPYTECNYDNLKAGTAFTADDMTANVYVWCEWNNEQGFMLIRPQILAAMDIGSMCWLNVRAVIRPKSQYNRDDVWGLIGDVLDDYGKFEIAILEGGTWQSKEIIGQLFDDETRVGGLRALGCKVIHTRTPRGKIIEVAFNSLQHAADNCIGFCGRIERVDCPENVKQALALVKSGKDHPRQHFLHISEYRAHLAAVMKELNHERNDGKICHGLCPKDKWDQDNEGVQRVAFPDSSKRLYRSHFSVVAANKNGVLVKTGTGKYQISYTYSHPDLVPHRGRRVAVFWNDYDPDTAAVIYTILNGKPQELICVAPRAGTPPRVGATEAQLRAESTRKSLMMNVARTERASMAEHLQRNWKTPAALAKTAEIDQQLQAVKKEQSQRVQSGNNAAKFRAIKKRQAAAAETNDPSDQSDPSDVSDQPQQRQTSTESTESISVNDDGTVDYQLQPTGSDQAQYVDYLLSRLTEFRKAGASFGQAIGNVSIAITTKIAKAHLGCDLHDESQFETVCEYLKTKIDATILGKRNAAQGIPSYHAFEEHITA